MIVQASTRGATPQAPESARAGRSAPAPLAHLGLGPSPMPWSPSRGFGGEVSGRPLLKKSDLTVNDPGDPQEAEADEVAEAIAGGGGASGCSCGSCSSCQGGPARFQAKSAGPATAVGTPAPPSVDRALSAPGRSLDPSTQSLMESRFGHDFARVRVHDDGQAARSAAEVNARAYTVGHDIVFGSGRYAPDDEDGRRLLAHELTHVVQQGAARPRLQRDNATPDAPPAAPMVATQAPTDSPSNDGGATPGTPPPPASSAVKKVVVSCPNLLMAIETSDRTYIYKLTSCTVVPGDYIAQVDVSGNHVHFGLSKPAEPPADPADAGAPTDAGAPAGAPAPNQPEPSGPGDGGSGSPPAATTPTPAPAPAKAPAQHFRGGFSVRKGQVNPAVLLHGQKSVPFEASATTLPLKSIEKEFHSLLDTPNCPISIDSRDVITQDGIDDVLFDPQTFEKEIWNQKVLLGEFGWIKIVINANAGASSTFRGSYGPGTVSDVCLYNPLADDRVGGRAHFSFDASLDASITLTGSISIDAKYLSIVSLVGGKAEITATGMAHAGAKVDSDLDVSFIPGKSDSWKFSSKNTLGLNGSLGFSLSTGVALTFLGETVWSETWPLVEAAVSAGWKGGLTIKPDLSIEIDRGSLDVAGTHASLGMMAASGGSGGGSGGGKKGGGAGDVAKKIGGVVLSKLLDAAKAKVFQNDDAAKLVRLPTAQPYLGLDTGQYSSESPGPLDTAVLEKVKAARERETDLSKESFWLNYAAVKYQRDGKVGYEVASNVAGETVLHAETVVIGKLEAKDPTWTRTKILALYTERSPCGKCAPNLAAVRRKIGYFPIYFSVSYSTGTVPYNQRSKELRLQYIPNAPKQKPDTPDPDVPDTPTNATPDPAPQDTPKPPTPVPDTPPQATTPKPGDDKPDDPSP